MLIDKGVSTLLVLSKTFERPHGRIITTFRC